MTPKLIKKFLSETKLLRPPQKMLSTFGITRIRYHLVSSVEGLPNKTRLREGWVVSERPQILTPDALKDRFEGFGKDSREFADWLKSQYQDLLRALEYRFKNQDFTTRVLAKGIKETSDSILKDIEDRNIPQAAVIECPDAAWSLAIMHFTLDEAARSFPTNMRDLDNHGLFDPGSNETRRRKHEIDTLFKNASRNPLQREALGAKLREYSLFNEYEDRFLSLYQ